MWKPPLTGTSVVSVNCEDAGCQTTPESPTSDGRITVNFLRVHCSRAELSASQLTESGLSTQLSNTTSSSVANQIESAPAYALSAAPNRAANIMLVDSGASRYMVKDINLFSTITSLENPIRINTANGHCFAYGEGSIPYSFYYKNRKLQGNLNNVLFVPDITVNLYSITGATKRGKRIEFENNTCLIRSKEHDVIAKCKNGLWELDINLINASNIEPEDTVPTSSALLVTSDPNLLWHYRLGHINYNRLNRMAENAATGMTGYKHHTGKAPFCKVCTLAKQHKVKISTTPMTRAIDIMEEIHTDLVGPVNIPSLGKSRYILFITDDKSCKCWGFFLHKKSEAKQHIINHEAYAFNQTNKRIKRIRCDHGLEFINKIMKDWADSKGIVIERSAPYAHWQNGVAERKNRTILADARALLIHAQLPAPFWAEAVSMAIITSNMAPTSSNDNVSPDEIFTGKVPDVSNIKVFGCHAYTLIESHKPGKFAPHSCKMLYMGPSQVSTGHKLFDPKTRQFYYSRNVAFDESKTNADDYEIPESEIDLESLSFEPEVDNTKLDLPADYPLQIHSPTDDNETDDEPSFINYNPTNILPISNQPTNTISTSTTPTNVISSSQPTTTHIINTTPTPIMAYPQTPLQTNNSMDTTISPIPLRPLNNFEIVVTPPPYPPSNATQLATNSDQLNGFNHSDPVIEGEISPIQSPEAPRRSTRTSKQPTIFSPSAFSTFINAFESTPTMEQFAFSAADLQPVDDKPSFDPNEPKSYQEAIRSNDANKWRAAMDDEFQSLIDQGTWELVDLPPGRKAIPGKWVYKIKYNNDETIERYKARFVAKGYKQVYGLDYESTYTPTSRATSHRIIFALARANGWDDGLWDVNTAYLNGKIDAEIYIQQPEGYVNKQHPNKVLRLVMGLYGIKQAGKCWGDTFNEYVVGNLKFDYCSNEICLYKRKTKLGFVFFARFVDDIHWTGDPPAINEFHNEFTKQFKI